ncbi:MAG: hypothetical protein R3Y49_04820 [Rikenellaceae bacterium]
MKHLFASITTLFLLNSCVHIDEPSSQNQAQMVIALQKNAITTMATTQLPNANEDANISNLILYIFDSQSQEIELIYNATDSEINIGQIVVNISTGLKDFYIVANYDVKDTSRLMAVSEYSDLRYQSTDLSLLKEGEFIMRGKSLDFMVEQNKSQRVDIELSRAAARIVIKDMECFFSCDRDQDKLYIDSIYLLNASALSSYTEPSYMFSSGKTYDRVPSTIFNFQNYDCAKYIAIIDNCTTYAEETKYGSHYYTYQNFNSDEPTLLVITGYYPSPPERVYYTFAINNNGVLEGNYSYEFYIEFYGGGSSTPETELTGAKCELRVSPWHEYDSSITFD